MQVHGTQDSPTADTIEDLYLEMHSSIFRFVHARVSDVSEAEDLTSTVFVQALRWYDPTRTPAEARSWLYQVARSVLGNHWRKHYGSGWLVPLEDHMVLAPDEKDMPQQHVEAEARVARLLRALPDRYRNVLELRYLRGASLKETASELDVSLANAKVLQHRALRRAAALAA